MACFLYIISFFKSIRIILSYIHFGRVPFNEQSSNLLLRFFHQEQTLISPEIFGRVVDAEYNLIQVKCTSSLFHIREFSVTFSVIEIINRVLAGNVRTDGFRLFVI